MSQVSTPAEPSSATVSGRPSPGDLAEKLAYASLVPLFPIGIVAVLTGAWALAKGGNKRQGWTAIVLGTVCGIGWFVLLLYFVLRHIESP